jgi:hypothetical protein
VKAIADSVLRPARGAPGAIRWREETPLGSVHPDRRKVLDLYLQVLLAGKAAKAGLSAACWDGSHGTCRPMEEIREKYAQTHPANRPT